MACGTPVRAAQHFRIDQRSSPRPCRPVRITSLYCLAARGALQVEDAVARHAHHVVDAVAGGRRDFGDALFELSAALDAVQRLARIGALALAARPAPRAPSCSRSSDRDRARPRRAASRPRRAPARPAASAWHGASPTAVASRRQRWRCGARSKSAWPGPRNGPRFYAMGCCRRPLRRGSGALCCARCLQAAASGSAFLPMPR